MAARRVIPNTMEPRLPLALEHVRSTALFEAKPPAQIFHYTDLDGVAGILESRCLWLSKISTLNDMSEVHLAMHHFKVLAGEAGRDLPAEEAALLEEAAQQLDRFRRTNICVGSFCEDDDQLAQWRMYGNDGCGIAIGFDTRELCRIAIAHDVRMVRCVYDPGSHVQITRDLAGVLLEAFRSERPAGEEQRRALLARFISTFLLVAPVIKDPHFGLEKEWRLVSMPRPADDHRLTAVLTGLVASVRFVMPLCQDDDEPSRVISSIVVGPTVDPENIADAVDVLARRRGFRIPDIRYSRIPYRPKR